MRVDGDAIDNYLGAERRGGVILFTHLGPQLREVRGGDVGLSNGERLRVGEIRVLAKSAGEQLHHIGQRARLKVSQGFLTD